ncbi:sulfite exporter TauE/SafE family protein [bacterium]|nr:sulfite exporter TauE/SafE family protein [bacterium]
MIPLWAALSLGFLFSFAHCLGMCGGIVAAYSSTLPEGGRGKWTVHLLYNLGRTASYAVIGLGVGALGSAVALGGRLAGMQGALSVVSGVLMILLGLGMLGWRRLSPEALPSFAEAPWFKGLFRQAMTLDPHARAFGVGVLNGWLPCGMVYSGAAIAATTGSALGGGLTMASFGLGTLPAMLLLGLIAYRVGVTIRQRLQQVGALVLIGIGVLTVFRGLV